MKAFYLAVFTIFIALLVAAAGQSHGQEAPGTPPSQALGEGAPPPEDVTGDFPSAAGTDFPNTMGSEDFPGTTNPEGFDATMPESGVGTGTNSTLGGSGTGSGGLGASTNAPYTEDPLTGR